VRLIPTPVPEQRIPGAFRSSVTPWESIPFQLQRKAPSQKNTPVDFNWNTKVSNSEKPSKTIKYMEITVELRSTCSNRGTVQTWPSQRRMAHGHKVSLVDLLPDRMDLFGRFWQHLFFRMKMLAGNLKWGGLVGGWMESSHSKTWNDVWNSKQDHPSPKWRCFLKWSCRDFACKGSSQFFNPSRKEASAWICSELYTQEN